MTEFEDHELNLYEKAKKDKAAKKAAKKDAKKKAKKA
jgi:hypothetical protein